MQPGRNEIEMKYLPAMNEKYSQEGMKYLPERNEKCSQGEMK